MTRRTILFSSAFLLMLCLAGQSLSATIGIYTSNDVYAFGSPWWQEQLLGIQADVVYNPPAVDIFGFDAVIIDGNVAIPSAVSTIHTLLQDGKGVCLTAGAPFFICGSTDLLCLSNLIGVRYYTNTYEGYWTLADDNPYCLPLQSGDVLGTTGGGSWASVTNPEADLSNRVFWSNGTLNSYSRSVLAGRYLYVAQPGSPLMRQLVRAGVEWLVRGRAATAQVTLSPTTEYVFHAYAINPILDTLYIGDFGCSRDAFAVDPGTILLNGHVTPISSTILPFYPGFDDPVICAVVPASALISYYGAVYDTTTQTYLVSAQSFDGVTFAATGQFTLIGRRSSNPKEFIMPGNNEVGIGDNNADGFVDIRDCFVILSFIFADSPGHPGGYCFDVDCSGNVSIADAMRMLDFLYSGGRPLTCD